MGIPLFFFKLLDQKRTKKHRLEAESVLCMLHVASMCIRFPGVDRLFMLQQTHGALSDLLLHEL